MGRDPAEHARAAEVSGPGQLSIILLFLRLRVVLYKVAGSGEVRQSSWVVLEVESCELERRSASESRQRRPTSTRRANGVTDTHATTSPSLAACLELFLFSYIRHWQIDSYARNGPVYPTFSQYRQ